MASELSEIRTYFGRCRCCLGYGYLKNMWKKHVWNEETEVYGEMLTQCFALSWEQLESSDHDQICDQCVLKLREAVDFKQLVMKSQMELVQELENGDTECTDIQIKIEDEEDNIIKAEMTELNSDNERASDDESVIMEAEAVYTEPSVAIPEDQLFEEVEFLEDDAVSEGASASAGKAAPFKYSLSRKYLFDVWTRIEKCTVAEKTRRMIEVLSCTLPHLNVEHGYFRKRIAQLSMSFGNYYKVYGRSKEKVLAKCAKWLRISERFELSSLKGTEAAANSSFESTKLPRVIVPKILRDNGKRTDKKHIKQHIKKPLNAFMLYIMEMRHSVLDDEAKNVPASTVNQILGKRWHLLSEDEKAKYYELARHEQLRHQLLYPNYRPRNNSEGRRIKRRKNTADLMHLGKCRATYGLEHKSLWCRPCIRKKKCIRYKEPGEDLTPTAPILTPKEETAVAITSISTSVLSAYPAAVLTTNPSPVLTTDPSPILTTDPSPVLTTDPSVVTTKPVASPASPESPHIIIKEEIQSDDEGGHLNVSALIDFEKDDYFTYTERDEK